MDFAHDDRTPDLLERPDGFVSEHVHEPRSRRDPAFRSFPSGVRSLPWRCGRVIRGTQMGAILLVRHAQASFGKADYDVLSSRGERQAAILAERLTSLGVDRVVHGGMRRQEHTAEICVERLGDVPLSVDASWGEYDHELILAAAAPTEEEQAAIEERMAAATDLGRAFQEVFEMAVSRWTAGGHDHDYAEPYRAFRSRVRDGLAALVDDGASGTTVVVTSGGAISAVVADHLGLDPDGWRAMNRVLVNTSITKLVAGRSGVTLLTVNDHAHLEAQDPDLLTYR